jgi:outer membrane protein OmpA-like peptidoglycan-associated protein
MATNLLDTARTLLTPDVVSKVSSLVGETPAKTQQALGAVIPSLAGVACNEASTPGGASRLFDLIRNTQLPGDLLSNPAGALAGGAATQSLMRTGSGLITSLLGDRAGSLTNLIAGSAGIQQSSASTLLSLAAPLLLGVLGRHLTTAGIGVSGLSSLLSSHRDNILASVPSGLGSALGLNNNSNICGAAPAPAVRPTVIAEPEKKAGFPLWGWLLPLLLLAAGLLTWRSCGHIEGPKMASITLPCGTVLSVQEGLFTYNVASFMMKGSDGDLPKRFVFDHLNFDSSTTRLTPDSNQTVTDLIAIMKCFPNMTVQLEGHTDSTGDPDSNKKLSVDRAEAVKAIMVSGGIDGSRIDTAGWGQEKPIASNDTEDGKARNRRTELVVTKMK